MGIIVYYCDYILSHIQYDHLVLKFQRLPINAISHTYYCGIRKRLLLSIESHSFFERLDSIGIPASESYSSPFLDIIHNFNHSIRYYRNGFKG